MPYVPPGGPVERGYTTPKHTQFTVIFLYSHSSPLHYAPLRVANISSEPFTFSLSLIRCDICYSFRMLIIFIYVQVSTIIP